MRKSLLAAIVLFAASTAGASTPAGYCDRNQDGVLTTTDAVVALRDAVETCRHTHECDSDGDGQATTADALLLLRASVGLPANLDYCTCSDYDQCFEDQDCIDNDWPANYHCNYTLCVRCEYDDECDEGEVCDRCMYECVPAGTLK